MLLNMPLNHDSSIISSMWRLGGNGRKYGYSIRFAHRNRDLPPNVHRARPAGILAQLERHEQAVDYIRVAAGNRGRVKKESPAVVCRDKSKTAVLKIDPPRAGLCHFCSSPTAATSGSSAAVCCP